MTPQLTGVPAGFQARVGKHLFDLCRKSFPFAHPGFQFAHPAIHNLLTVVHWYRHGVWRDNLIAHHYTFIDKYCQEVFRPWLKFPGWAMPTLIFPGWALAHRAPRDGAPASSPLVLHPRGGGSRNPLDAASGRISSFGNIPLS